MSYSASHRKLMRSRKIQYSTAEISLTTWFWFFGVSCLICTHFSTPQISWSRAEDWKGWTDSDYSYRQSFKWIQGCPVQFNLRTLYHHRNTAVIKNNDKATRTFCFTFLKYLFLCHLVKSFHPGTLDSTYMDFRKKKITL